MTDPLDNKLRRAHDRFDRDHERLRDELMTATAATAIAPARRSSTGRALRRRFAAAAAVLVAAVTGAALWLSPAPAAAAASQAFADVLSRIREARSVSYSTRLELPDRRPQTARVVLTADGWEHKTLSDGAVQLSDYPAGEVLLIAAPPRRWTARVVCPPAAAATLGFNPVGRLKSLAADAGRFRGAAELDGRPMRVYDVVDGGRRMTIWADDEARPVRIEILSDAAAGKAEGAARLVMSDFRWDEPRPASRAAVEAAAGEPTYVVELIDPSRPADETDLTAMLGLLADVGDGVFPPSLEQGAAAAEAALAAEPAAVVLDQGAGLAVVAGADTPGAVPAVVRYLRARQRRLRLQRGAAFVARLARDGRPMRYVGAGARRGGSERVFWYKPAGASDYRVIYADLTVREAPARLPAGR